MSHKNPSQSAKKNFRFGSGRSINNLPELASAIPENEGQAVEYLYNGDIENWLKDIGEEECADFANRVCRWTKSQVPIVSRHIGLYTFLKFISTNDPLVKQRLYNQFYPMDRLLYGVNDFKDLLDHALFQSIVDKVSRKSLVEFIKEYMDSDLSTINNK